MSHPYMPAPERDEPDGWWKQAACRDHVDLFDATETTQPFLSDARQAAIADARFICTTCPVLDLCAADVLERETRGAGPFWGVVAGMTPGERDVFTKLRKASNGWT